jgi:signal transduction histidine kinase/CheY-like chemotaxis protein
MIIKTSLYILTFLTLLFAEKIDLSTGTITSFDDDNFTPESYSQGKLPIKNAGVYLFETNFSDVNTINDPTLYLGLSYYPVEITINGSTIYKWGDLTGKGGFTNYRAQSITISKKLLSKNNRFTMKFYSDGLDMEIAERSIDEFKNVSIKSEFFNAINVTGIRIGVSLAILMSITGFITFFIIKANKTLIKYFSFFTLSLGLAFNLFLFNSSHIYSLFQSQLSRIGTLLMSFFLFSLISEIYKFTYHKKIILITFFSTIPIIITTLLTDSKYEVETLMNSHIKYFMIFFTLSTLLVLIINFKHKKGSRTYWVIITCYLFIIMSAANDTSSLVKKTLPAVWLIPYSYIFATLIASIVFVIKQYHIFLESEKIKVALQKSHKELKEAKRKIENEAKHKDDFIRTVAHELRTPITSLVGGIRTVLNDSNLENSVKRPIEYINLSAHRLSVSVSNIFSFIEAKDDTMNIVPHSFSVKETVQPIIYFYKEEADSKGISLIYKLDNGVPKQLFGDGEHLALVLDNIIGNAVKFTDNGGVSCTISYSNEKIKITVSDTGRGITVEKQKNLFNAFSRKDQFSFSKQYEGIGLGLAITDATVKAMNGKTTLSSTPEKGSTFSVTIPMMIPKIIKAHSNRDKKILVVEDNTINSMLVTKQLENDHFIVSQAYNGKEAVELVSQNSYDAILMDIQMPIMDGMVATKMIRELNRTIPILALSANGNREECLEVGMNEFMMKPISTEKLLSIISTFINDSNF